MLYKDPTKHNVFDRPKPLRSKGHFSIQSQIFMNVDKWIIKLINVQTDQ